VLRSQVAALTGHACDYLDPRYSTPTLDQLTPYGLVFTWANYAYADRDAMGDILADYVDQGGIVLLGQWCLPTAGNYLGGRIMDTSGPYLPCTGFIYQYGGRTYAGDGTTAYLDGVDSYSTSYRDDVTVRTGFESDGTYTDGYPFLAYGNGRVFYAPGVLGTYGSGDHTRLIANLSGVTSSPPDPPSNLEASDGLYLDAVEVTWDPATHADEYQVYRHTEDDPNASAAICSWQPGTSFDDLTAEPERTYWYWVKARNEYGESDFSDGDSGYLCVLPPAPTSVEASDGTYFDRVAVTWEGAPCAEEFLVYRHTEDDPDLSTPISEWQIGTSFDDLTAELDQTYWYWVKARNINGESDFSDGDSGYLCVLPPPATNVQASDGTYFDRVAVTWEGAPCAEEFRVFRHTADDPDASTPISDWQVDTSFEDMTAALDRTYWYWVKARNINGESDFSEGDSGYRNASTVLWDQSNIDTGVNALVDQEFGNHPSYASYMVMDVAAGDGWNIQSVTTHFTNTSGIWSPSITQGRLSVFPKTGSLPDAGDDPSASAIVPITLSLGPNGWEATASGLDIDIVGDYWIGLTPIADFDIYNQEFHQAAPIIGADTAWRNPGGSFGCGTGWTTASVHDPMWAGTWDAAIKIEGTATPPGPPDPPAGVDASDGTYFDRVAVTWEPSSYADEYQVYRHTVDDPNAPLPIGSWQPETSFDDLTAEPEQNYWYWVKARNEQGESDLSNGDSGFLCVLPPAPAGVHASDGTFADRVTVTWEGVPCAEEFRVYRHTDDDPDASTPISDWQVDTSFDDLTAEVGQVNWYWVKARNINGESDFSDGDTGYYDGFITLHVPSEFPTIQAAIDAARDGDKVLVADGVYTGEGNFDLDFGGKAIIVCSENGPTNCVIDCDSLGRGFVFQSGEGPDSIVRGFTITNGYVVGNGGAILCSASSPTLSNLIVTGNSATVGGGICCRQGSHPRITNCLISHNTAAHGGGILCSGHPASDPAVTNCTLTENTAQLSGGALYSEWSFPAITNCVLWDNAPGEVTFIGGLWITYSDIRDGTLMPWFGEGCLDADPVFVDPAAGDYRLADSSPCIDAGCNWAVPRDVADLDDDRDTYEITPLDLDGEGRFFDDAGTADSGCGYAPIVDMGACEFGGTGAQPCFGDLDGDRDVDLADLAALLASYGVSGGVRDADLDCDGDVDLSDLAAMLSAYRTGCE
jgi:fibronectin type 3 domain-containing protein